MTVWRDWLKHNDLGWIKSYSISWKRACSTGCFQGQLSGPRALQRALTARRRHQLELYQCPALHPFSRGAVHQTAKPSLPQTSRKKCQTHLLQRYKSLLMLAPGIKQQDLWNISGIFADSIFPPVIPGKECRCWRRQEKASCQELHPGRLSARKKKGYELNCMYCSRKQIENMDTSRKHNFWRSVGGKVGKSSFFPFSIHEGRHSGEINMYLTGLSLSGASVRAPAWSPAIHQTSFTSLASHPSPGSLPTLGRGCCAMQQEFCSGGAPDICSCLHPHSCITPTASLAVSFWREK